MARSVQEPPPDLMVRQLNEPSHTVGYFEEVVERTSPRFQSLSPIRRGTPYNACVGADQTIVTQFSGNLVFLRERVPYGGSDIRGATQSKVAIWIWGTDTKADDATNANIEYFGESITYPIFTRVSTIRRNTYEASPAVTYGTALTALIGIKVTAGGTGYSKDDTVVVSSGSATADLVVDSGGTITNIIVTNEGSGYDSASLPTISFTTSTGIGATAVAIVQDKTAVLISQKKIELADDDTYSHEYIKVIRVYRKITGPLLQGQDYFSSLDVVIPWTKQEVPFGTGSGTNRKEVGPIDTIREENKTYDVTAIATVLNAISYSVPDFANLDLPHVLQSITCVMSKSTGLGDGASSGSAGTSGTHGSYSLPGNSTHQSSAAITSELLIQIKDYWSRNIPSTRYTFFMALPFTAADVLTKLATLTGSSVNTWPQFRPVTHDLLTTSRRISLQVSARTQVHFAYDAASESDASLSETSYSKEIGLSTQVVRISPTIHGTITISGTTSDSQAVSARAHTATSGTVSASADTGTISDSAAAAVSPTSLAATGGTSAIPSSGLYIVPDSSRAEIFGYGFALLHFEIVNFANVT